MWRVRRPLPEISATLTSQLCMILPYLNVALESQELLQHIGRSFFYATMGKSLSTLGEGCLGVPHASAGSSSPVLCKKTQ